jgi:predicted ArsR family transcriptional regulator
MAEPVERIRALLDRKGSLANRDVAAALRISPATSHRMLRALVTAGVLELHGRGPASRYGFRRFRHRFRLRGLEEDRAWRRVEDDVARIRPLPPDELRSLQYAVSEIVNNAIDHSGGRWVEIAVTFDAAGTTERTPTRKHCSSRARARRSS